ncbi:MAG TPA: SCP2 sterol-binding domain-containing protein [Candidatus Acidoferrales bacterium]|nr:SCP2 sterol-binding domain-containing protein [Candidatus Acidoferrales bacterium]
MARTAREIFETHNFREDEPLLRGVCGSYLFDIDQVGSWFVQCDQGKVNVDRAKHDTADCVIHCSEQDFVDMIEGRRNMVTAWMQGRVEVQGDVGLAQKFNHLVGTLNQKRRGAA